MIPNADFPGKERKGKEIWRWGGGVCVLKSLYWYVKKIKTALGIWFILLNLFVFNVIKK